MAIKAAAYRVAECWPKPLPEAKVMITRNPVKLVPPQFGKPDRELARAVCWHITDATPPTIIPFNLVMDGRLRRWLRTAHIPHH